MNQVENLYNILEIKKDDNQNKIRVAYKKLALQWHLDKNENDSEFVIETLPYYSKPCVAGSNILLVFFQNDGGIVFNI